MLGAPCSPCCEQQRCPQWKVQEFYDLVVSASVSLTLAGTSEERQTFTLAPKCYFPDIDITDAPAYVYNRTVSPVGTFPLSLVPAETAINSGSAKVVFAMTHEQTLHARLELMVLDLLEGNTQWPGIAGVESPCEVLIDLTVWQDVVTKQYRAQDILGPATRLTASLNSGQPCAIKYFQPQAALSTTFFNGSDVLSPGVWFEDKASGAVPVAARTDTRGYFGTSLGMFFLPTGGQTQNSLSLTVPQIWAGVSFTDMPRFVQTNPAAPDPLLPSWINVSQPAHVSSSECAFRTTSQGEIGKAFTAGYLGDITSWPGDPLFRSHAGTFSYITPTISLDFA